MKALKFNHKAKHPLHRLPFIGSKSKSMLGFSFWNVPSAGGYEGGCMTGNALAWLYLKSIESNSNVCPNVLSSIIIDIKDTENSSTQGQIIGFFEVIESVLQKLITDYNIHFPEDERELLAKANAGLNYSIKERA